MRRTILPVVIILLAACGEEDLVEPTTTTLELRTVTRGDPVDPDGYAVRVDGGQGTAVGVNATVSVSDLSPGGHEVELSGIAPNCLLVGSNPRTIAVSAGSVTRVRFDVQCRTAPGSLEVMVATSGESPDPDGYTLRLDGGAAMPVATAGTVRYPNVVAGEHEVRLAGLAPNCVVTGDNPRLVTVGSDAVRLDLEIRCGPPTGTVRVVTATVGPRPDADGYLVTIGGAEQPIGPNASLTVPGLPVGDVLVQLGSVATNCQVAGDNPRTVPLTNGESVVVSFEVSCQPSGDGLVLFTSNRSGSYHLYRVREDGTDLRDLTPSIEAGSGDWSPDGSRIVSSVIGAEGLELFVMNADGSDPVALGVAGARPKWSPDGRKIAFTAGGAVTVMNADGTGATALAEGYNPDWSPDGTRIAFDRIDRSRCVADLFCPSDLYVMTADGTGVTRLASAANASDKLSAPDWSPDGRRIAFTRVCCFLGPNETGVYVVSAEGGPLQRIYQASLRSGPLWSPDGSAVAVALARPDGTTELVVIPSSGGNGIVLASSAGSEYPQAWR